MPASPAATEAPCQIYAIIEASAGAEQRLAALLTAVPLSCVLIRPAPGQTLAAATAQPLVALAQKRDCAALIEQDAALARTLRADGVHLSPGEDVIARYQEARSIVGGGAMVGVDVGGSRHLAMEAGEAGADYVAFSVAPTRSDDDVSGLETRDDLLAWWAEVFEVPCVAFGAGSGDEARAAAGSGADFVTLSFGGGETVQAAAARLKAAVAAVEGADHG